MSEVHDIIEVERAGEAQIVVTFDDGARRRVDLRGFLEGPVFEPLRDPQVFAAVRVDRESGTVVWPTGADLDPIAIYECSAPLPVERVEGEAPYVEGPITTTVEELDRRHGTRPATVEEIEAEFGVLPSDGEG
jgi:hypothetical protein